VLESKTGMMEDWNNGIMGTNEYQKLFFFRLLQKKSENLSLASSERQKTVMLNPDSASHPLVQFGEILKQVQDDRSRKFQIFLVSLVPIFQPSIIPSFHHLLIR
jgi:hypothetical protein